jgi:large subunit ribosomal protein L2
MGVKKYKPVTPGQRGMTGYTFEEITKSEPERALVMPLRKSGGRNMYGRVTVRHRGGGNRRFIRIVDFKREKYGIPTALLVWRSCSMPTVKSGIFLLHWI